MNLMPLADRLEAAGLGTKGVDLFLNMMPADVTTAIMMRPPLRGTPIDWELPGFYKAEFQLIVRSPSYEDGLALTNQVVDALTIIQEEVVGPLAFNYCRPRTEPVAFPISEGNLLEFNVYFDACYVKG